MNMFEEIKQLLDKNGVTYKKFHHKPVRTSEEAAKLRQGYSISQGAKAIVIKAKFSGGKREYFMIVLPGDARIDSKKARKILGAKSISFASGDEVLEVTGGVKPGGVPPFGNLFGMKVFADVQLAKNEEIIFNAGSRTDSIAMKYEDYKRLVRPEEAEISEEIIQ